MLQGPEEVTERLRHDLMNRLTIVVGYAQLLANDETLPASARERARLVFNEANECVRLIESLSPSPADQEPVTTLSPSDPELRGRVLVVDDEAIICSLAKQVLSPPYVVYACGTTEEALALLSTYDFDAILVDLHLPGPCGGKSLFEHILLTRPTLTKRVVFMSGGVVDPEQHQFLQKCGCVYIQKPFSIETLRAVVERVRTSP